MMPVRWNNGTMYTALTAAVDSLSRYIDRKWNGRPSAELGLDSVDAECGGDIAVFYHFLS